MISCTKLNYLMSPLLMSFCKLASTRAKLKYFIQANGLYQLIGDEISFCVNVKWYYSFNEYKDKLLCVIFVKSSSVIDDKLFDLGSRLTSLFNAEVIEQKNEHTFVSYTMLVKSSGNLDYIIGQDNVFKNELFSLSKYYCWDYKRYPHLLLAGNSGSGKSYQLYEILSEAKRITNDLFVCDGKNDELTEVCLNLLGIENVSNESGDIQDTIKRVVRIMDDRYRDRKKDYSPLFVAVDEYASLKLMMSKQEFIEFERLIKLLILKGRAANIHVIIALQRASSDSLDLAIRDNCSIRIGLGALSNENYKMIFGEYPVEHQNKKTGNGKIYKDGIVSDFEAFRIKLDRILD